MNWLLEKRAGGKEQRMRGMERIAAFLILKLSRKRQDEDTPGWQVAGWIVDERRWAGQRGTGGVGKRIDSG